MSDNDIISEEKIKSILGSIPEIGEMEALRLNVRKRNKTFIRVLLIAVLLLIAGAMIFRRTESFGIVMIISLVVAFVGFIVYYSIYVYSRLQKLKSRFQENIIKHYIRSIMPESQYNPEKYHSLATYNESLLFMIDVDRHSGGNYVEGIFDKTEISFSYMHTEYEEVTHTKNGTKRTWHTIFKGIFMSADSNKNFSGKTLVLPDTAEKYLGGFGKWLQKKAGNTVGELVYMENVKFEKEFVVYSTDPVEARYLITPKIQEQIFNLKKFLHKDLRLSFVNNHVFIAISRENIFKLKTSLSFTDEKTLIYYMKDIIELLTLIHLL
ncbi:MAG: DUF3137 domain-containing protein, partial [Tannerella sp.]|nr:DUF3137 domain-containing protein [Tannerella sp.]